MPRNTSILHPSVYLSIYLCRVASAENLIHRHNECRYFYEMRTRIQSQHIRVERSSGNPRLTRLIVVSDTASLYGPILNDAVMHCTSCPGPYRVVSDAKSPSCTILESCALLASFDVVISNLCHTLESKLESLIISKITLPVSSEYS